MSVAGANTTMPPMRRKAAGSSIINRLASSRASQPPMEEPTMMRVLRVWFKNMCVACSSQSEMVPSVKAPEDLP